MKSLNKAFMEVYGEALAPYGFRKVKSRQPYIIRLINDEIVHVLTVIKEDTADYETSGFRIYAGVATVYRLKLDFNIKPIECKSWLNSIDYIYKAGDFFGDREDRFIGKYECIYKKNDENALMECMRESLKGTKEVALRVFDKIKSLKMCIWFWEYYQMPVFSVHVNMLLKPNESNEGAVSLIVFDSCDVFNEHVIKRNEFYDEYNIRAIKAGRRGGTVEEYIANIDDDRVREVVRWEKEGFAYFKNDKESIYLPAYDIDAADATGAGDNFLAGFASELIRGGSATEALEFANACGAICATAVGAGTALQSREQVTEFIIEKRECK